ncbi:MAG: hypothetical protein KC657_11225 [Myxococcales bacterium]|nr:hypothetical protein [Myxococcales bacterium]
MPFAAVTVIVLVAAGEPVEASSPAMTKALHAALGDDARVVVEPRGEVPDDGLLARADAEHATLVGVITWADGHRKVTLHFARASDHRWADREIRFDAADAAPERWRTVGFAIASMFPEETLDARAGARAAAAPAGTAAGASASSPGTASPSTTPAPAPPSSGAPPPASSSAASRASRSSRSPDGDTSVAPDRRDGGLRGPRVAIDATALAASAIGGYGGGLGGGFAVRVPVSSSFRLRGALSARAAELEPASATSRAYVGTAGVAWERRVGGSVTAGARAGVLVELQEVVHFSADDPSAVHQSRWLPGVAASGEVAWHVGNHAAVCAALGAEGVLGTTAIFVRERQVASLTPVRLLGEAGVRVSF